MANLALDKSFWRGRRVFLTGHTGFKGAWLTAWLTELGANVVGYSLAPVSSPSLFQLLGLPQQHEADITDAARLTKAMQAAAPDIVFHLAAQSLVTASYDDPVGTFATNVVGTAALLNAVRSCQSVSAVVVITSDKCYENREWSWGYRETDRLGGHDAYSASKAAAEIIVSSMRNSFFAENVAGMHRAKIATVRAGNVIGGGDWAENRLVPDIVRAAQAGKVVIRNPNATRPWQHVLEPLAAYMGLAQLLVNEGAKFANSYNFGPLEDDTKSVAEFVTIFSKHYAFEVDSPISNTNAPHEANNLALDCSMARSELGWRSRWNFENAIEKTASWYSSYDKGSNVSQLVSSQIAAFEAASPY